MAQGPPATFGRTIADFGQQRGLVRRTVLRAGDPLFRVGDSSTDIYVLRTGLVKTVAPTVHGRDCLLEIVAPGGIVGLVAPGGFEQQATATAMTPSLVDVLR